MVPVVGGKISNIGRLHTPDESSETIRETFCAETHTQCAKVRCIAFFQSQNLDRTRGCLSQIVWEHALVRPIADALVAEEALTESWENGGAKMDAFDGFTKFFSYSKTLKLFP